MHCRFIALVALSCLFNIAASAQLTFDQIYAAGTAPKVAWDIDWKSYQMIADEFRWKGWVSTFYSTGSLKGVSQASFMLANLQTTGETLKVSSYYSGPQHAAPVHVDTEATTSDIAVYDSWIKAVRGRADFARVYNGSLLVESYRHTSGEAETVTFQPRNHPFQGGAESDQAPTYIATFQRSF